MRAYVIVARERISIGCGAQDSGSGVRKVFAGPRNPNPGTLPLVQAQVESERTVDTDVIFEVRVDIILATEQKT